MLQKQPTERVQQMKGGFEPLPLFDCFYCCKEHFVLRKCSECMISFKCNITIGMIDLASKRYARQKQF